MSDTKQYILEINKNQKIKGFSVHFDTEVLGGQSYYVPVDRVKTSAQQEPWDEMLVMCDNCGHAIHVKREDVLKPEQRNADKIWDELSKVYNMNDVPETAKEIIGNVMLSLHESEPQWIPVTERLPEIKQRVLITYNTEDGLKTDVTWYDKYGFMLSGNVTAWMPMVEPYKEESGE